MDYDWGKKDDILGEIHADIRNFVDRGVMEVPLTRNGHPEKGIIRLSMSWEPTQQANNNNAQDYQQVCILCVCVCMSVY